MFGAKVPNLNMKGKEKVTTSLGVFASMITIALTMMFASLKMQHLIERKNPDINVSTSKAVHNDKFNKGQNGFKTSTDNFMMAFTVENETSKQIKSDPRYVQWVASFTDFDLSMNNRRRKYYPLHRCTMQEFKKFGEPANK